LLVSDFHRNISKEWHKNRTTKTPRNSPRFTTQKPQLHHKKPSSFAQKWQNPLQKPPKKNATS
jgi:hypothetical protein